MCTFEILAVKVIFDFYLKVPKIGMVRIKRLELPRLSAPDPKSDTSILYGFISCYILSYFRGFYKIYMV